MTSHLVSTPASDIMWKAFDYHGAVGAASTVKGRPSQVRSAATTTRTARAVTSAQKQQQHHHQNRNYNQRAASHTSIAVVSLLALLGSEASAFISSPLERSWSSTRADVVSRRSTAHASNRWISTKINERCYSCLGDRVQADRSQRCADDFSRKRSRYSRVPTRIAGPLFAATSSSTVKVGGGGNEGKEAVGGSTVGQDDRAGGGGLLGYGLPRENAFEIVRLELAEVPVDRMQDFLRKWAKLRVDTEDPGWQGAIRPIGKSSYGLPKTAMSLSDSRSNLGVTLSFDGSPSDVVNLDVLHLSGGGSCIIMHRGVDGLAKLGGMGPHIASLIRHSEGQIKAKLEQDMTEFSVEYHRRILRGQAPVAPRYADDDSELEDRVIVQSDGVIDVTPAKKRPRTSGGAGDATWKDKSVPPPVPRMLDEACRPVEIGSSFEATARKEPPGVETLFADIDTKQMEDFDKEAFDLFKTMEKAEKGEVAVAGKTPAGFDEFFSEMRSTNTSDAELMSLFEAGKDAARRAGASQTALPAQSELAQLEIMIGGDTGLRGGIDIFAGPPKPIGGRVGGDGERAKMPGAGEKEEGGTYTMYDEDGDPVLELSAREMAALDEDKLTAVMATVDVLITELLRTDKHLWQGICVEYTDLYLNPYYILAMRARIPKATHEETDAMHAVNQVAVSTVQELADMHVRLEMQQLEKIRDICEAAMEDMDSLPEKVRYMKPLLDDNFVAYLTYAIHKERNDIARHGVDPDLEQSRWLQVLGVIQKGVFAEVEKDIKEDVLAIAHIMKMRSPEERFALLNVTIATLPSMHVRGFKNTATNIVDHYRAQEDCMDQKMRNMVLEMGESLKTLMSEERMKVLCEEIDTWAAQKAKDDSIESKMRRIKEHEAEERELLEKTASGLWNKKLRPSAKKSIEVEERDEIRKLTEAIKEQNLLPGGGAYKGDRPEQDDIETDDDDDGMYTDDADVRRKLSRLSGPGGALESESRIAPHLMTPGSLAASIASRPDGEELVRRAKAGTVNLGEVFSKMRTVEYGRTTTKDMGDSGEDGDCDVERDSGTSDGWGSFDDDDWLAGKKDSRGREGMDASLGSSSTPIGAAQGQDVPGLLGGERFESFVGEEWGGAVMEDEEEEEQAGSESPLR